MHTRPRPWLALWVLIPVLLPLACSDSSPPRPVVSDPYQPATSPEKLLANLREAYLARDAEGYEALLADGFTFYFSIEDQVLGELIERGDEVALHERMFADSRVAEIELEFSVGDPQPDPGFEDPLNPGTYLYTVTMTQVELKVHVVEGGSTIIHWLDNAAEQFWFRPTGETDPGTQEPLWEIARWQELPVGDGDGAAGPQAPLVERASWGGIKSMFR